MKQRLLFFLVLCPLLCGYAYTSLSGKFSLKVPDNYLVINKNTFTKYEKSLPKKMFSSFKEGNEREIFIKNLDNMSASFIVTQVVTTENSYIDIRETCNRYKSIDKDNLLLCEGKRIHLKEALVSVSYNGPSSSSYIRAVIKLEHHFLFIVHVGKWESKGEIYNSMHKIIDMMKTVRAK